METVTKKEKNRTPIPPKTILRLWVKAAGRCQFEGCNKQLWRDDITMKECNKAYVAHIVAAEEGGERGDPIRSKLLCTEYSNLMLLCADCHNRIDEKGVGGKNYPEDVLLKMKQIHEERIERQTGIHQDKHSEILLFGANIGKHDSPLCYKMAHQTIIDTHYPSSQSGIQLGLTNSGILDHNQRFWECEEDNLRINFDNYIKRQRQSGTIKHLSVFGLAPQPLLILLGSLLGDLHPTEVYQLHREPKTWKWLNEPDEVTFEVIKPQNTYPTVALVFALSATITEDRVVSVLGEECSIWTFTVNKPNNDFLRNREQLARFRTELRSLLNEIKARHGQNNLIHVFPAMPNAMAIELGRVRMPKADLPMLIYDQNFQNPTGGFYQTIKID